MSAAPLVELDDDAQEEEMDEARLSAGIVSIRDAIDQQYDQLEEELMALIRQMDAQSEARQAARQQAL